MGVTTVPENPQRVAILTNEGTEALLALGVTPVAAANSWQGDPWYAHIAERMQGVEAVGKESAINLELLAALEPDLIIGNKQRQEKIYEQLSSIAPTVLSARLRGDWTHNFKLYAKAVNREQVGQEALDAFVQRTQGLADALGDALNEKVSVVRFLPGHLRIYQRDSFSGWMLNQVGFARPANQDVDEFALRVGRESIPDMDGDRIFHFTWDSGDGKGLKNANRVLEDPLWQSLTAVQAGRVHAVEDTIWNTAGGMLAAELMLQSIAEVYGVTLQ
ncbi:MAG: iron-siderophore ABC transporter substrate-binding protein [Pseudomonadota bacterium]